MLRHNGLRPFRVAAHAFGPDCPSKPLIFSRQHRVLVAGRPLRRILGSDTALAHIHTLATPGRIEQVIPPFGITYHHLLFAGHQLLQSHGMITESLLLTPFSKDMCALFQGGADTSDAPDVQADMRPARALLRNREARRLMRMGRLHAPACQTHLPKAAQGQRDNLCASV